MFCPLRVRNSGQFRLNVGVAAWWRPFPFIYLRFSFLDPATWFPIRTSTHARQSRGKRWRRFTNDRSGNSKVRIDQCVSVLVWNIVVSHLNYVCSSLFCRKGKESLVKPETCPLAKLVNTCSTRIKGQTHRSRALLCENPLFWPRLLKQTIGTDDMLLFLRLLHTSFIVFELYGIQNKCRFTFCSHFCKCLESCNFAPLSSFHSNV